jgi:hypothetical protein
MRLGPFEPTIERGLDRWRFVLGVNAYCPSFDFTWTDVKRFPFRGPIDPKYQGGVDDVSVTAGFETFGTVEGWVELDGARMPLTPDRHRGTRDRHWGIRLGVGGPPLLLGRAVPKGRLGWVFADMGDWCLWGDQVMVGQDLRPARVLSVARVDRRLRFEEDTCIFAGGVIDMTLNDGTVQQLELTKIGQQGAYLRCGLYGGPNGGAPGSGRWHGVVDDGYLEGGMHDLNDPKIRTDISGLNEHHCAITCDDVTGTGIFQSYDPAAFQRCERKIPGWRFLT